VTTFYIQNWVTTFYIQNWVTTFYIQNWVTTFYIQNWVTTFYIQDWVSTFYIQNWVTTFYIQNRVTSLWVTSLFSCALSNGHILYPGRKSVSNINTTCICRAGQNRVYASYTTVYLVISLPKIPYTHRTYMVVANPTYMWMPM